MAKLQAKLPTALHSVLNEKKQGTEKFDPSTICCTREVQITCVEIFHDHIAPERVCRNGRRR